ncbi:zinc finger BED domain-containing protein RICESLEEPER 2-like [Cucumis melo var. makuwa]|uniref:Zinc finger BED domain-containing protein RICESLEEPER 2-like n=1 Tax=Cucumis melo var. makuwa TaxID=1194695 RepID=A0A5A7UUY9_CUCMM|nr:zinc finger BED domain-containing protein RICESLEEPER 2-like [Cucumis melo var. makuwa]
MSAALHRLGQKVDLRDKNVSARRRVQALRRQAITLATIKFARAFDKFEDNDESYRNEPPPTKHDWSMARMLLRPEIAKMKTTTVENVLRCIFQKYKNSLHGSTTSSASIGVSASSSSVVDTILDMDVEDKQDMEYGYTKVYEELESNKEVLGQRVRRGSKLIVSGSS